jgi:hypothetical protein
MTTCQTLNTITSLNVVSTPPGARTWSTPEGKILVYKVENTLNATQELTVDNRRNN